MNEKTSTLAVHVACVLAIALCLTLAYTVLRPYPEPAGLLVLSAVWLWGKLGFKPADPVLARILQTLGPDTVAQLSTRPPPLPVLVSAPAIVVPARKVISVVGTAPKPDDQEPK